MASADDIAAYYDKNTRHFLALGGSGEVAAIHRAIWAPGVSDQTQAFNYLNLVVARHLQPCLGEQARVLDLGCGVGGTSLLLAATLGVNVVGVTISQAQQQQATLKAAALGLSQQCHFVQGDFAAMPDLAMADAAFAIESFVHANDAASFFAMAAGFVRAGGRLVICDDFLSTSQRAGQGLGLNAGGSNGQGSESAGNSRPAVADFWVKRFKAGWHINNLISAVEADSAAQQAGFKLVHSDDLSSYTRAFHPLLLAAVSQLTRLPLPWAYWHNLAGGSALQICLKRGWTRYQVLVFEKQA